MHATSLYIQQRKSPEFWNTKWSKEGTWFHSFDTDITTYYASSMYYVFKIGSYYVCECGHWGYPILGLPHTDKVKTILWFMTTLRETHDMVLHQFLIKVFYQTKYIYIGILSKQFHTCNRKREICNQILI